MKRPKGFEDAVLDLVLEISEAENRCAERLAKLTEDEWAVAVATFSTWLEVESSARSINWQKVAAMAEHLRSTK